MNDLKRIIDQYVGDKYEYTIKRNAIIIKDKDHTYVFKKRDKNSLKAVYQYLRSRDFSFFPNLIEENDQFDVMEYIDDVLSPKDQKAHDLIYLLAILHNKTTYFTNLDIDESKAIYENTMNYLEFLYKYYQEIIDKIDYSVYMSPSEYMLARNITKVFQSIIFAKNELDEWYDLIKTKNKKRMVLNHNNLSIDHLLKNDNMYLISWEKANFNLPIYDLYFFYRNNFNNFDFSSLFRLYENKYPLLEEERKLFFILISIPDQFIFMENEFNNSKNMVRLINYINTTEQLITPYYQIKNEEQKHH